jgi:NAD(P)-dependent dehydrogenase (short-subunit alcohol dehydrogenase family)
MGRVEGKVALVTGGAAGLGEADARLLAKEGAKVVITTRKKVDEGQSLTEEIRKDGGEAVFFQLDVSKEEDWKRVIGDVIQKYGTLNVIVNNAGISVVKTIEETSLDDWNAVMGINAAGVFLGTKYGIETMKNSKEPGSIVNISSVEVHINESFFFAYNADKGAVRNITKTAAVHCCEKGYNIRVNTVYPGYIYTPMLDGEARDYGLTSEQYLAQIAEKYCPIGHVGEPLDIAYAVLYLASDESKFATGTDLIVDGGIAAK